MAPDIRGTAESLHFDRLTTQSSNDPCDFGGFSADCVDSRSAESLAPSAISAVLLNAGVTQRLECLPYEEEVGGPNPSACTIPTTKGRLAQIDHEDWLRFGHLKWTAGSFSGRTAYVYRSVWSNDGAGRKCRTVLLHREILGAKPGEVVDHRNGDTFDNRRSNLRIATPAQNALNKRTKPGRFGFIGVDSQTVGSYRGRLVAGRVSYYTGTFPTAEQAARARDALALLHHGEWAVLNFPLELGASASMQGVGGAA